MNHSERMCKYVNHMLHHGKSRWDQQHTLFGIGTPGLYVAASETMTTQFLSINFLDTMWIEKDLIQR
jgi:hypothetical protein